MTDDKKNGCALGCLVSAGLFAATAAATVLLFSMAFASCAKSMSFGSGVAKAIAKDDSSADGPQDEAPAFTEVWSFGHGDRSAPKIVRIRLEGSISGSRSARGIFEDDVDADAPSALDRIHSAMADDKVRGILLEVDSPGGEVTMSDILNDAIMRFRESDTNRFVLALVGDMACSGAYYAAVAADRIMVRPTSWVGSIGVIIPAYNAASLAAKVGVASTPIVSGRNKAMLDPLRPQDPEQIAILQRTVDQAHKRFVELVAEGRHLPVEKVRELADGRVLTARDAIEAGLVDCLGYEEEAMEMLCEMAGAEEIRVYRYESAPNLRKLFSSSLLFESVDGVLRKARAAAEDAATPRAEYRLR